MDEVSKSEEIVGLKKELSKLRLEANLRKSLAVQLEKQKKVADEAKAEALSKSQQLEEVSLQLSKYLSPQIYDQIFSGKQNAEVKSYRKKLSVFFSDIVNFTHISDELESEELTGLLNFYLNEMSQIALKFGGTIDKYIGDALMVFFGDPESLGYQEDAKKCVAMAIEMQKKMMELKGYWGPTYGLKEDLRIRIGVNTGYCTVGNFGSDHRLDYTAVGGAVNLASRLEGAAEPDSILVSQETFLLLKESFAFYEPKNVEIKGLGREVQCYQVRLEQGAQRKTQNFSSSAFDLKVRLDDMCPEELVKLKEIVSRL
mgnify:CR=1 FL=1